MNPNGDKIKKYIKNKFIMKNNHKTKLFRNNSYYLKNLVLFQNYLNK